MERLVSNISASLRRERRDGRDFLVAPVTMIVPGVLDGSEGPLLYSSDEIAKNISKWEGSPLLLDHPEKGSGRLPEVWEKQGLGILHDVKVANDKLVGEAWFDVKRTMAKSPSLMFSLSAQRQIEVSTGLGVTTVKADEGAVFNGVPYEATATDFKPDHLAVLAESVGACSINDGCGVNNQGEISHSDLRSLLRTALAKRRKTEDVFITDVFDDVVVYEIDSKLFRLGYAVIKDKVVLEKGKGEEVVIVTTFEPVTNQNKKGGSAVALSEKDKTTIIDRVIKNVCCFDEEDREVLNAMTDDKLAAMNKNIDDEEAKEAVHNAAVKGFTDPGGSEYTWDSDKKVWNTEAKKLTEEEVANEKKKEEAVQNQTLKLTTEQEENLAFAATVKQERRDKAIAVITENKENRLTEGQLKRMPLDVLQNVASSLPKKAEPKVQNYAGAAGGTDVGNSKRPDPLGQPTMDFNTDD